MPALRLLPWVLWLGCALGCTHTVYERTGADRVRITTTSFLVKRDLGAITVGGDKLTGASVEQTAAGESLLAAIKAAAVK